MQYPIRRHHVRPDKPITKRGRMAWHKVCRTLNVHPRALVLRSGRCKLVGYASRRRLAKVFGK